MPLAGIGIGRSVEYQQYACRSGCYEERYRLTWQVAGILATGLLFIVGGVFVPGLAAHVILTAVGALLDLPLAGMIVTRRIAFRADQEGIIFGPHPVLLAPGSRFSRVSVPWKDIDKISLYKEPVKGDGSGGKFIGTVPRQPSDAAAEHSLWLAYCPLDLECLAAVTVGAARALPSSTPVTPMPIRMLGLDAVGAS